MSIPFDPEVLVSRMKDALAASFTESCFQAIEKVKPHCESPIEVLLGATLFLAFKLHILGAYFRMCLPSEIEGATEKCLLVPQFPWHGFRIDWVLLTKKAGQPSYVFIECDGHEFHERTPAQAERDRAKDRQIQMAGIPILRFTGREIHRDVGACVAQILNMSAAHGNGEGRR